MALLGKLKSILGLGTSDQEDRDVTVTVEHDPQSDAAVEGTEPGSTGGFEFGEVEDDAASDESSLESAAIEEPGAAETDAGSAASDEAASDAIDEAEPDAVADDGEAAAAEPDAADEPVDSLSGIGPAYAERLGEAGVETVGDLANADAADVAERTDLAEGRVQGWIDQAREQ